MKTRFMQLKLGVLLTGLVILTSCDYTSTLVSTAGINAIYSTIPSLAIKATKYTGYKISNYLKNPSETKNENGLTAKKIKKAGGNKKVMPISIGIPSGARLVSSKPASK